MNEELVERKVRDLKFYLLQVKIKLKSDLKEQRFSDKIGHWERGFLGIEKKLRIELGYDTTQIVLEYHRMLNEAFEKQQDEVDLLDKVFRYTEK